ncbi:MAG TPA: ABC transporter permease subunit [Propionibacteriaceae bacterium]
MRREPSIYLWYVRSFWLLAAVPGVAFLLVGFLIPLGRMLASSVLDPAPGLGNFERIVEITGYLKVTVQTLEIAALATLFTFLIGYPIAYLIATSRSRFTRQLLLFAIIGSQLSSVLTRTFAWQVVLGASGPVGMATGEGVLFTKLATTIGLVQFLLPFMVLPLVTVMHRISPNITASSLTLGAGPAQTFTRVFVPMTVAGVVVSTVLVFAYSVGAYATPAILGGQDGTMLGVLIETTLNEGADPGFASALSVLLMVIVGVAIAAYRFFFAGRMEWLLSGDHIGRSAVGRTRGASPWRRAVGAMLRAPMSVLTTVIRRVSSLIDDLRLSATVIPHHILAVLAAAFLLLPQVFAMVISFSDTRSLIFPPPGWSLRWYEEYFSEAWLSPTWTSVVIAVFSAFVATSVGGLAAIAAARTSSNKLRALLIAMMLLPLMVPAVVTAAAFYVSFVKVSLTDSVLGLIIAHSMILMPFTFGIVLANVQSLNHRLELAAEGLGAGKIHLLRTVLIPQMKSGLLLAYGLAFLVSFDESVIGIFLSDIRVRTLPAKMFEAISLESNPTVGAIATLMTVLSLACFFLYEAALRVKRMRRRTLPRPVRSEAA